MRALTALGLLLCACASNPANPSDASVDRPAVDAPPPPDAPAVDAPALSDARTLLAPRDAGEPFTDAGPLGEPQWAPIEVNTRGSCAPLIACGGMEQGTWDVSGGCVDVPIEARLSMCPTARVTRSVGRGRGRVTFAGGFARRIAQWEAEVEVFIPQLCASFVGGCPGIEASLRGVAAEAVCASEGAGDCRCAARQAGSLQDGDGYSIVGQQIVSATLNRRWNYCVTGDRLRYQDASPSGSLEPGRIELTRRAP